MIAMTRDEMLRRIYANGSFGVPEAYMDNSSYIQKRILETTTLGGTYQIETHYIFYSFEMSKEQLVKEFNYYFPDLIFKQTNDGSVYINLYDKFTYMPFYNKYMFGDYPIILELINQKGMVEDLVKIHRLSPEMGRSLGRYAGSVETWPFRFGELTPIYDSSGRRIPGKFVPDDIADYILFLK